MKRVEIRVRDEAGKVISEQVLKLDIGAGRFHEIEQAKVRRGAQDASRDIQVPLTPSPSRR